MGGHAGEIERTWVVHRSRAVERGLRVSGFGLKGRSEASQAIVFNWLMTLIGLDSYSRTYNALAQDSSYTDHTTEPDPVDLPAVTLLLTLSLAARSYSAGSSKERRCCLSPNTRIDSFQLAGCLSPWACSEMGEQRD